MWDLGVRISAIIATGEKRNATLRAVRTSFAVCVSAPRFDASLAIGRKDKGKSLADIIQIRRAAPECVNARSLAWAKPPA
jgi:hypothetical protein